MTKQAAGRRSMLVRIPDAEGTLVTYQPTGALTKLLGITVNQINNWHAAGSVRAITRGSCRYYSLADATLLRLLKPAQSLALGLRRVPPSWIAAQKKWNDAKQEATGSRANHHREEWDSYDRVFVLEAVEADVPVEAIATTLGRTYHAVCMVIGQLREAGDLPAVPRPEGAPEWARRAQLLMTAEERERIAEATGDRLEMAGTAA
jgi:DNA-binding transcriptional MerR regulator